MGQNPYTTQPDKAFWKRAIGSRHYEDLSEIWDPPKIRGTERFATAGSCFAQHLGRHVRERSPKNYMDLEPAPSYLPSTDHERFGYGIYSCRYGNIYTSRQLLQLAEEALGERPTSQHVWERKQRFYDALRPTVDPVGNDSPETVLALRQAHLGHVRTMLTELDFMIFTLGLTETWISPEDGTAFPTAPGVIAGSSDAGLANFHNLSIDEVREDLEAFWSLLKQVNPSAQMILTVSPVPLIATATSDHVLSATMYSKSVLRVAAQHMSNASEEIHYFPSYELVNSAQGRGYYFNPDLRTVNDFGVSRVMSHFFSGDLAKAFPAPGSSEQAGGDVVCDEEAIESSVKIS